MATVSNCTLSNTLFKWLNEMSYVMAIDAGKSAEVCVNCVADPNDLRDDNYTCLFYGNPGECIEFLMQQPEFGDNMLYAAAKEFNDDAERIYSEAKSSDWW
jgi:hypothetical protein